MTGVCRISNADFLRSNSAPIPSDRLQKERKAWESAWKCHGWGTARCDEHGERIRIVLRPFLSASGVLYFFGALSFCCDQFAEQIGIERDKLMESEDLCGASESDWREWLRLRDEASADSDCSG